MEGSRKD